jgi:hypothetical protein
VTLPTIHANGTPKRMLVDALCNASHAIDAAYDALRQTAPNGRDYYPQEPTQFEQAQAEHFDRMKRLDAVKEEIDQLTIAIDQIGE